jgi:LmbE family N-acetylglucosaminyl deacetylase
MQAGSLSFLILLSGLLLAAPPLASPAAAPPEPVRVQDAPQPLSIDSGADALWQSLQKLDTRASILLIDAHPDDEDGGMLTRESRGEGARTALLSLNRGEGGQNAMSDDEWDRLGLLRTQELLAAGRYYGLDDLYFTRVADFGFSKTREEALALWGHDRVLYDVVRAVRLNRPLVLASVFVGGITDGHGQHQVSGEMAQEAFKAAGDPRVFPDQIRDGLPPWSPLKVYARVPAFSISSRGMFDYATGHWAPVRFYDYVAGVWSAQVPSVTLRIQEGDYDPLLGEGFFQLARQGLAQQKSQIPAIGAPLSGPISVPYHRYGSLVPAPAEERSFFDGIDVTLAGIASLAPNPPAFLTEGLRRIADSVHQATAAFSPSHPELCAPILARGMRQTGDLIAAVRASSLPEPARYNLLHELTVKQSQFNTALLQALGVKFLAVVTPPQAGHSFAIYPGAQEPQDTFTTAVPGQTFSVAAYLTNPSPLPVRIESVALTAAAEVQAPAQHWTISTQSPVSGELSANQRVAAAFQVTVPADASPTRPYFHRDSIQQPYYDIDDPRYLNLPQAPFPLQAHAALRYRGVALSLDQAVQTVQHIAGRGVVYQPLVVAPAISLLPEGISGVIPIGKASATVTFRLHSNLQGPAAGTVRLRLPTGWTSSPESVPFATEKAGQEEEIAFAVQASGLQGKRYPVSAVADCAGAQYFTGYAPAGYPGLRPTNYYPSAPYVFTGVDLSVAPHLNVGYIMGTGDSVPQALAGVGVAVHLIPAEEIARGDLGRYDVIVLGIRAYVARPELAGFNQRLLEYVHRGGVLIAQYGLREFDHNYGPYPYSTSSDPQKVVDENSAVSLLDPRNPVLNWPNRIQPADFQGWVEERGHGFLASWDPRYQPLVEMHDPDQEPQKGGLLYARYGRGTYVYVALALYRQLQLGVPGAYRIFANLLSLPKAPNLSR